VSENDARQSGLSVLRGGVHTTLQDIGRFGHAAQGLSQGGAMDLHAHCWANRLLANSAQCPSLEMAVGMGIFRAEADLLLAITGADMQAELDGIAVRNWCSLSMKRGQTLALKPARDGLRSYLAVQGGFQSHPVLGSVSTVVRNGLGSILSEGDFLPAASSGSMTPVHVPKRYVPVYSDIVELRVIESYQAEYFPSEVKQGFYQARYRVSKESDRMGMRLQGQNLIPSPTGLVSEGIALGAIQIPPDGQPIILLNDRQTLGGYPKVGCVARVDLPKLAQAHPGTRVSFSPIALEQARAEWQDFCAYFDLCH